MPYILDGNNLIGRFRGSARPTEEDRRTLVAELAERLRQSRARAVLFFDGPAGGRPAGLGPLTVRSAGSVSADDAIVREIESARAPGEIIVVTSDRGLEHRCRDAGAQVCPPEKFFARFGRRRGGTGSREEDRRPAGGVDVDEWLRYFADPRNRDTERE